MWVTDLGFVTGVSCLPGTDFAAPTAVPHQAHPRRTSGLLRGASAGPVADLFALIGFQRCSRGGVRRHTALCPATKLHLVIKVTLEEDPETTHGSGGDMSQTGGLQSDKLQHRYLVRPLPISIGFQFFILPSSSSSHTPRPCCHWSTVLHSFLPPDLCTEAS